MERFPVNQTRYETVVVHQPNLTYNSSSQPIRRGEEPSSVLPLDPERTVLPTEGAEVFLLVVLALLAVSSHLLVSRFIQLGNIF